jgi:hypothetical protein
MPTTIPGWSLTHISIFTRANLYLLNRPSSRSLMARSSERYSLHVFFTKSPLTIKYSSVSTSQPYTSVLSPISSCPTCPQRLILHPLRMPRHIPCRGICLYAFNLDFWRTSSPPYFLWASRRRPLSGKALELAEAVQSRHPRHHSNSPRLPCDNYALSLRNFENSFFVQKFREHSRESGGLK